jgi:hypothetical protein
MLNMDRINPASAVGSTPNHSHILVPGQSSASAIFVISHLLFKGVQQAYAELARIANADCRQGAAPIKR